MRFYATLPKEYTSKEWDLFPFIEGKPSLRVENGLENVLYLYSNLAKEQAKNTDNNKRNFKIEDIFLVGSAARENRVGSDLDFLLIAPKLDEASRNNMKLSLSYVFFCDRPKQEAIDLFVRNEDIYPSRTSFNIKDFFSPLLEKYNKDLIG